MQIVIDIPKRHEAGARWASEHILCVTSIRKCPQHAAFPECFCYAVLRFLGPDMPKPLRAALKQAVKEEG